MSSYNQSSQEKESIAYNLVREQLTRDELRTAYVNIHDNHTYLLMKVLPMSEM